MGFGHNDVNSAQQDVMRTFERDFEDLMSKAIANVKGGRNFALFSTKLEEAAMWLNKAIAHDGLKDGGSDGA